MDYPKFIVSNQKNNPLVYKGFYYKEVYIDVLVYFTESLTTRNDRFIDNLFEKTLQAEMRLFYT